ncbi:MAG: lysylphosphatidylglycerol synthase transmembrane domain-containing protein [Halorhodospira sp.]
MLQFAPPRLLLFTVLFLALSALGAWVIYAEIAERSVAFDTRLLEPPLLASLAALLLVYFAADGLRLHFTLRALGCSVPVAWIVPLVFINLFFSNVTPMATGGGVAQIWYLQRRGVPVGTATAATTMRTLLAAGLIFTGAAVLPLVLSIFDGTLIEGALAPYLIAFAVGYIGFFAIVLRRTRWLLHPADAALALLQRLHLLRAERAQRWRYRLRRELSRFRSGITAYFTGRPLDIALSVLFTAVFLMSLFSFPALLLWGLDYTVSYGQVLALLVVTTFIMYISPTPGASGIAEGAFGHFFADFVSSQHLVLITVAWRFLTIFLGMGIGAVFTARELSRGQEGKQPHA